MTCGRSLCRLGSWTAAVKEIKWEKTLPSARAALQGAAQGLRLCWQHLLGVSGGTGVSGGSSLQGGHQDLSTASLSSSSEPFERLPCNLPPTLQPAPLHLPVPRLSPYSLPAGQLYRDPGKIKASCSSAGLAGRVRLQAANPLSLITLIPLTHVMSDRVNICSGKHSRRRESKASPARGLSPATL